MERGNRLQTAYRWLVVLLGTGLLALVGSSQGHESLALLLFLCALAAGTEVTRVPAGHGFLSLSSGVVLAAVVLLGVPAALWVAVTGHLLGDFLGRRLTLDSAFNAAQAVLAVLAAAVPYHFLGGTTGGSSLVFLLSHMAFLLAYFLANHVLVELAVVLEQGTAALADNRLLLGWDLLGTLLALPTGLFLVQVYQLVGFTALGLAAFPLLTLSYIWQLYARVRAANREIVALYAATSNIGASIDLNATLQEILRQARTLVYYDRGILYLADEDNLMPAAAEGAVPGAIRYQAVSLGEELVGRVGLTRYPEVEFVERDAAGEEGTRQKWSELAVPLVTSDNLVGVLRLSRARNKFSEREVQFLAILTGQAATALENARLYSEVAALARLDALTGIYNRRALVETLKSEIERCRRYGLSLTVLMVDLDNFKQVNDTCGHQAGDALLKKITASVASNVRSVDMVGRYGGDEIAVILPETRPLEAYQVADRIRQAVRDLTAQDFCEVTTSIGLASYPQQGEDPEMLLVAADRAMYYAKRQGGNRVLSAAQLPPVGTDVASSGGPEAV